MFEYKAHTMNESTKFFKKKNVVFISLDVFPSILLTKRRVSVSFKIQ